MIVVYAEMSGRATISKKPTCTRRRCLRSYQNLQYICSIQPFHAGCMLHGSLLCDTNTHTHTHTHTHTSRCVRFCRCNQQYWCQLMHAIVIGFSSLLCASYAASAQSAYVEGPEKVTRSICRLPIAPSHFQADIQHNMLGNSKRNTLAWIRPQTYTRQQSFTAILICQQFLGIMTLTNPGKMCANANPICLVTDCGTRPRTAFFQAYAAAYFFGCSSTCA